MSIEQFTLFGPLAPVEVVSPRPIEGARWSAYHPVNRVQCQHCVLLTHQQGGSGPVDIRTARHKRVTADGELLLCHGHRDIQYAKDEAAGLVGKDKKTATRRKQRPAS